MSRVCRGAFIGRTDVHGRAIHEGDMVTIVGSKKQGLPAPVKYDTYLCAFVLYRRGYSHILFDEDGETEYEVVEEESW